MARRVKKHFFKILPMSVVVFMVVALAFGFWQGLPINMAQAADDSITINSTQFTLSNDADGNNFADIGDTVTLILDISNTDGGCVAASTTVTANMAAYGGTTTDSVACTADNGGANDIFTLNLVVTDGAGSGIDVPANNVASAVTASVSDADEAGGGANPDPMTPTSNNLGDGVVDVTATNGVDTVAPNVTVAGTVTLSNDIGGEGVASIGDTITYAAGTETTGDGITWTVDLSAYGLSAAAVPGPYVVIADDDDAAFSANEMVSDNANNVQAAAPTAVTLVGFTNIDNIVPNVTVAGTVTLSNDIGGEGVASIGDTITYAAGTETTGDGITWTVDLSAYGLSAAAVPGPYVVIADDDDAAFSANEMVSDNANNVQAAAPTAVTLVGFTNIDNIVPNVTVAGTVTLSNDIGGEGVASIGDTITYAAGTETTGDGITWTVDLSAYGLSAAAVPGPYVVIADDDDAAFSANEMVSDNANNVQAAAPTAVTLVGFTNIDNIVPNVTVAGTVTLSNDIGGEGVASIGDTITYAAGTETTGDGITWTVDLSAYGLSAAAVPGPYVVIADDDDAAFSANEMVSDNANNVQAAAPTAVTLVGFTNIDNIVPNVTVAGTVTLSNDIGGEGVASIGDTITYAAGTETTGDGITWTVDLSAYGLSAAAVPGPYVVIADDDDAAFSANEMVSDNANNVQAAAPTAVTLVGFTNIDNIVPNVTVAGTVTLSNDIGGEGVASIGDTITYAAGTETTGDGITWTVDLSAYGLSAAAVPGPYVVIADDDDAAFSANEMVSDNANNVQAAAPTAVTLVGFTNIDNIVPNVTVAGTVTLSNDIGGEGVASIGDTITYAAGTETTGDGITWTVDLSAYGLSAAAVPGPYVVIADDDDAAFSANEMVSDNANNVQAAAPTAVTLVGFTNIDNIVPNVTVAGTVTLSNDIGGEGVASIGDTITYAAGTETTGDGITWTVDLSAYGLSAAAVPGPYVVIADDDDNVAFSANETVTDNANNVQAAAPTAVTLVGFANIDNVAPTIISATTDDGDSNGQIDVIVVVYDSAINDANYDAVAAAGYVVNVGGSSGSGTATLNYALTESGSSDTDATPVLTWTAANATDLGGNNLNIAGAPANSTDGALPVVVSTTPANGASNVIQISNVVVNFSEPMNTGVGLTISDDDSNSYTLPATWTNGNATATVAHAAWTIPLIVITATVDAQEASPAGNTLLVPYIWSFTTWNGGGGGGGGGGGTGSPPICDIKINNNATSTDSLDVSLDVTAVYGVATQMLISDNSAFAASAWETYSTSKDWTLEGTEGVYGTYTIYAKIKDSSGRMSATCNDTIDYVAPGEAVETPPEEELPEPIPIAEGDLVLHDSAPAGPLPTGVSVGTLVKRVDMDTVYFVDNDNRRHTFPTSQTFFSWYANFDSVQTVPADTLAAIPLGSNVTMRPGTYLVKIQSSPHVYAVEDYGVIKWIADENIATQLYGADWASLVVDVDPTFFINYQTGLAVDTAVHPDGSVIQYTGDTSVYLIDNGQKRLVSPSVFEANLMQIKFIAPNILADLFYGIGDALTILPMETLMSLR